MKIIILEPSKFVAEALLLSLKEYFKNDEIFIQTDLSDIKADIIFISAQTLLLNKFLKNIKISTQVVAISAEQLVLDEARAEHLADRYLLKQEIYDRKIPKLFFTPTTNK
jgi:hypothetical protein